MSKKRRLNVRHLLKLAKEDFKLIDKLMIGIVIFMQGLGTLMIYSITSITMYSGVSDPFYYMIRTGIGIVLGGSFLVFMFLIPYKYLRSLGFFAIALNPIILLITLLIGGGPNVNSWIDLGFLSVQPAEFVKIGLPSATAFMIHQRIYLKNYDLKRIVPRSIKEFRQSYWAVALYSALCCALIIAQPDMGTTIIIFFIAVIIILSSGLSWKTIAKLFVCIVPIIVIAGLILVSWRSYQAERFLIWLDPFNHPNGVQNVMGYTAMALGGLFGVGIGQSTQKYGYVIEPHNDFIVTILAEELGVITVLIIIMVYIFIALRCFHVATKCKDIFGSLLMIGIGSIYLVQPVINLGGASGFLPLTGVTLPFISYGGTSTMMILMSIGVYLNVAKHVKKQARLEKEKVASNNQITL